MGLTETILFYLLFGIGIAAAVAVTREGGGRGERVFRMATAMFFWPLFLPVLLEGSARERIVSPIYRQATPSSADSYASAIAQVEAELETALDSLDGWAENVLAREQNRFAELRAAWRLQAERLRELERLLASPPATNECPAAIPELETGLSENGRYRQSEQARRENLERLRIVRSRLHDDLMGTLAWVRELVSMIHLAKFTGAPASRAEELVAQIATAVEGLSEVTQWREQESVVK
jgi:hypothetical protein